MMSSFCRRLFSYSHHLVNSSQHTTITAAASSTRATLSHWSTVSAFTTTKPHTIEAQRQYSLLTAIKPTITSLKYTPNLQITAGYKPKGYLRKRCPQCYFVKRKGRLFIECKAKQRHKQMQKISKRKLFRED